MISFSRFFAEDDERRKAMARRALDFWHEHYASGLFWRRMAQAAGLAG
jgi:hypothetical protein